MTRESSHAYVSQFPISISQAMLQNDGAQSGQRPSSMKAFRSFPDLLAPSIKNNSLQIHSEDGHFPPHDGHSIAVKSKSIEELGVRESTRNQGDQENDDDDHHGTEPKLEKLSFSKNLKSGLDEVRSLYQFILTTERKESPPLAVTQSRPTSGTSTKNSASLFDSKILSAIKSAQQAIGSKLKTEKATIQQAKDKKIEELGKLKEKMLQSIAGAAQREKEMDDALRQEFGKDYRATGLPQKKILLDIDYALLAEKNLVYVKTDPIHHYVVPKKQDKTVKRVSFKVPEVEIPRSINNILPQWAVNERSKLGSLPEAGILEMEAEIFEPSPKGELEPRITLAKAYVNKMAPLNDEELRLQESLRSRLTYLKNPRFQPHHQQKYQEVGIVPIPASLTFANYEPHKTYTQYLSLVNDTNYSRHYRLCPAIKDHYSKHFKVSMVDCPSDSNGLIAAGLAIKYKVEFTPDSFLDFKYDMLVETETGQSFPVPLMGQTNPVVLNFSKTIECGEIFEGKAVEFNLAVKNIGGNGQVCFVTNNEEANAIMPAMLQGKVNFDHPTIQYGQNFELSPRHLNLKAGQETMLRIKYAPIRLTEGELHRRDSSKLYFLTHDGHVSQVTVNGTCSLPKLEILKSVEYTFGNQAFGRVTKGNLIPIALGKPNTRILAFGNQNPGSSGEIEITIRNHNAMKFPFFWAVSAYVDGQDSQDSPTFPISITPSQGWIDPISDMRFKIKFTPQNLKHIENYALLYLTDHVKIRYGVSYSHLHEDTFTLKSTFKTTLIHNFQCTGKGSPYSVSIFPPKMDIPCQLEVESEVTGTLTLTNSSVSEVSFCWNTDQIPVELAHINLLPMSGKIAPNSELKVEFKLRALFPGELNRSIVCDIAEGKGAAISFPIQSQIALPCSLLRFGKDRLDFGFVQLGQSKELELPIRNQSSALHLRWNLNVSNLSTDRSKIEFKPKSGIIAPDSEHMITLKYTPYWYQNLIGTLECTLTQAYIENVASKSAPSSNLIELTPLNLDSSDITVSAVEMIASALTPQMKLINSTTSLTAFTETPISIAFLLQNETSLETYFKWKNISSGSDDYIVSFHPAENVLQPNALLEVRIQITFLRPKEYKNIKFECQVPGMIQTDGKLEVCLTQVIVSELRARIKVAPAIAFFQSTAHSEEEFVFDFGKECPMLTKRHIDFFIHNLSPKPFDYDVWVMKFKASNININIPPDQKEKNISEKGRLLLKPTKPKSIGFSSKAGETYINDVNHARQLEVEMNQALRSNLGVAFQISPASGKVAAWSTVRIRVTSLCNLAGSYTDTLCCKIGDQPVRSALVNIDFVGHPIKLFGTHIDQAATMPFDLERVRDGTAKWHHKLPSLNFGTRMIQSAVIDGMTTAAPKQVVDQKDTISKVFYVENQSPVDVELKWSIFSRVLTPGSEHLQLSAKKLLQEANLLQDKDQGVFSVTPTRMIVPAFQTLPVRYNYRSIAAGSVEALAIAQVGYMGPDKQFHSMNKRRGITGKNETVLQIANRKLDLVPAVYAHAKTVLPHLVMETGAEQIEIRLSQYSDAIAITEKGKPKPPVTKVTLKNPAETDCILRFDCEGQFQLGVMKGGRESWQHEGMLHMKAFEEILIRIEWKGSSVKNALKSRAFELNTPQLQSSTAFAASQELLTSSSVCIVDQGSLVIQFSNGLHQSIPLLVLDS